MGDKPDEADLTDAEKRREAARGILRERAAFLIERRTLLLTVTVTTEEQAETLMGWYTQEDPASPLVSELAWDKVAVSKERADMLQAIEEIMRNGQS